jgi:hypothetical protein
MKKTAPKKPTPKAKAGNRLPAGAEPRTELRLSPDLCDRIDAWAALQKDRPDSAEAIRRLLLVGLKTERSKRPLSEKAAAKASELAGKTLDTLGDKSATEGEREQRKRRLLKGPKEFR